MTWNPTWEIASPEWFMRNLRAVFLRDAAEARAWAHGDNPVPAIYAVRFARGVSQGWPVINILPFSSDPERNEDNTLMKSDVTLLVEVENVSRQAEELQLGLIREVRALKSICLEMSRRDLTGASGLDGMVEVEGKRGGLHWDVTRERYAERFYATERTFTQVGSFVLPINFVEGRR